MTIFSKADAETIATIEGLNVSPTAITSTINNAVGDNYCASTFGMLRVLESLNTRQPKL